MAVKRKYIVKLEEGKVFYIGPLFFSKEALGPSVRWDLRFATRVFTALRKEDKDFWDVKVHHEGTNTQRVLYLTD